MKLAQDLLNSGISGFEFASGIPGTIGGAVKMNAGAYGKEMKDIIVSTKCLELKKDNKPVRKNNIDDIEITEPGSNIDENNIVELSNKEQQFRYRNSVFSNKKYIVFLTNMLGNKNLINQIF